MALGSAGVFTAVVAAYKAWLKSRKIAKVELVKPNHSLIIGKNFF